jgi:hypothetical protein
MPVRRLLNLKEYSEVQDVMTIFAQGHSVTRFLVARKDRAAFLKFVKAGMGGDWDNAAKASYGFENVEALEAAWLADLDATRKPAAEIGPVAIVVVNGRMAVSGPDFDGVADRIEWDQAKGTVTLTGRDEMPAAMARRGPKGASRGDVRGRKIVFNYRGDTATIEGAYSGTTGPK